MSAVPSRRSPSPPAPRLVLYCNLVSPYGRRRMTMLDEALRGQGLRWRLSVRHLGDLTSGAFDGAWSDGDALIIDSDEPPTRMLDRTPPLAAITTPCPIDGFAGRQFLIEPTLAGSMAADCLLRRGYRRFLWRGTSPPDDSPFAMAFVAELQRAGLADTSLAAAFDDNVVIDDATAVIADRLCDPSDLPSALADTSPPVVSLDRNLDPSGFCHLVIGVSPRHQVEAMITWLAAPEPSSEPILAFLPPRPPEPAELLKLPIVFPDSLVSRVSAYIDERLDGGEASDVERLSARFDVPRRTLERRFRDCLGTSIHREMTRRQIARARRHLLEPGVSAHEAATRSGYPTTRMLAINLRKLHGAGPREFQKAYSGRLGNPAPSHGHKRDFLLT